MIPRPKLRLRRFLHWGKRKASQYESPIPEGAARRLRAFYRPLNAELCRLLDRAFAWGGSGVADE